MPVEVILPKVDMDMESGVLSMWHMSEGDLVQKGDVLFEIETDKSAMEIESPASGHLHHVSAEPGAVVPIGKTVAWIYVDGEEVGAVPSAIAVDPESEAMVVAVQPDPALVTAPMRGEAEAIRATPAARHLSQSHGIDIGSIAGSGPLGRIQRADIEALVGEGSQPKSWVEQAGELNVVSSGSGAGPNYVMIHGFAADANGWSTLKALLGPRARVHQIELPNHGTSPRRLVSGFADLVAQVRDKFDAVAEQPVRLIGHSLGGAVALALTDTRARKVKELTMISPCGLGPEVNGAALRGIVTATRAASLAPWLRQLVHDPELITDGYAQAAASLRRNPDLRAAQGAMMEELFPDGVQAFDLCAALHRVSCPARIIWGKRDKIIPWSHALQAPGHISLNLFEDVGHLPHVEAADALHRLLA